MALHELAAAVLMAVVVGLQPGPAQTPGLTIVVIEGEDAVNIIQQKTAVRAVVEVRDRNNLPVSGATVTFSIGGQGAGSVGGSASTLTVTTNTAGRAALSGLTPTTPGTVQISVSAAYQGLGATTVIAQTIVATAAQAAALGGAAAAGAAGGGGLGTGAIIGIVAGGAAVAGGAVVAGGGGLSPRRTDETGQGPGPVTTPFVQLPTCVFAVAPTLLTVPLSGGTFVLTIEVSPSPCGNPTWIVTQIPSIVAVDKTSGTGNGTVTVVVSPFISPEGFPTRTSAIGIASTVVIIHQPRALSSARPER